MSTLGRTWKVLSRKSSRCSDNCRCKRHVTRNSGQFKVGVARPDVSINMAKRHAEGTAHQLTSKERVKSKRALGKSQTNPNSIIQARKNLEIANHRSRAIKPEYGPEWTRMDVHITE